MGTPVMIFLGFAGVFVVGMVTAFTGGVVATLLGRDVDAKADAAAIAAVATVKAEVAQQISSVGPAGPFSLSVPSGSACPPPDDGTCAYATSSTVTTEGTTTVAHVYEGSATAGALQQNPAVNEHLVALRIVTQITTPQGSILAVRSQRITLSTAYTAPTVEVVSQIDDSGGVGTGDAPEAGCDPTSTSSYQQTCDAAATQAGTDTRRHALTTCVDDGNPADGLCGPATPRPADQFSTPSAWQDNDATSSGVPK